MKIINEDLKKFIKNINNMAPINKKIKYPYKPALILAIFQTIETKNLFNKEINLANFEILEKYYEYIALNYEFWEFIKNSKSKKEWFLGINNNKVKRLVLRNILEMPSEKLCSNNNVWTFDKKNKNIKINIKNNIENYEELKKIIIDISIMALKSSNEDAYHMLDFNTSKNFKETIKMEFFSEHKNKGRGSLQHLFSIDVKDRDGKCVICCIDLPDVLEACHIKPYSQCETDMEKIDPLNGVTLCRNHHRLFDNGLFTFNRNWNVKFDNKWIFENDINLFFKQYESCYSMLPGKFSFDNEYIKYHNKHIYKGKIS